MTEAASSTPLAIALDYSRGERPQQQRINAVVALGLMKDTASLEELRRLAKEDKELAVRTAALRELLDRLADTRKASSWWERFRGAGELRKSRMNALASLFRSRAFLPGTLIALLLPFGLWVALNLASLREVELIDVIRYAISAGLALLSVLLGTLLTAPSSPRGGIFDFLAEVWFVTFQAVVIGLATAVAVNLWVDRIDVSLLWSILIGTLIVVLVRIETMLLYRSLVPDRFLVCAGIVLASLLAGPLIALLGYIVAAYGEEGQQAFYPAAFLFIGLPTVIALTTTYVLIDRIGNAEPRERAVRAKTVFISTALTGVALLGLVPVVSFIVGRVALAPVSSLNTAFSADLNNVILRVDVPYSLKFDKSQEIRVDTGSRLSTIEFMRPQGGATTDPDRIDAVSGSRIWVDVDNSYSLRIRPDDFASDKLPFERAMSHVTFLTAAGYRILGGQPVIDTNPRSPDAVPSDLGIQLATIDLNTRDVDQSEGDRVQAFVDGLSSVPTKSDRNFVVIAGNNPGPLAPGSLLRDSAGILSPIFTWPGVGTSAVEVAGTDLRRMTAAPTAATLKDLEVFYRIHSPYVTKGNETAVSRALRVGATIDGTGTLPDRILALRPPVAPGDLAVYLGGTPFAQVSIGTILRVTQINGEGGNPTLQVVLGRSTARSNQSPPVLTLSAAQLGSLGQSLVQSEVDLALEIQALSSAAADGLPEAVDALNDNLAVEYPVESTPASQGDLAASRGAWLKVFPVNISMPEPEIFRNYFAYIVDDKVSVIQGTRWDFSENPYFKVIIGEQQDQEITPYLADLTYLGPRFDEGWRQGRFQDIQPFNLLPAHNSPDDIRSRAGQWVSGFDINSSNAPDTFSHYFMVASNTGVDSSAFAPGTIVKGTQWSTYDEDRAYQAVFGWGSPTGTGGSTSLSYLGPDYDPSWEQAAYAIHNSLPGAVDLPILVDKRPEH